MMNRIWKVWQGVHYPNIVLRNYHHVSPWSWRNSWDCLGMLWMDDIVICSQYYDRGGNSSCLEYCSALCMKENNENNNSKLLMLYQHSFAWYALDNYIKLVTKV